MAVTRQESVASSQNAVVTNVRVTDNTDGVIQLHGSWLRATDDQLRQSFEKPREDLFLEWRADERLAASGMRMPISRVRHETE